MVGVAQALLLLYCTAWGSPLAYLALWVAPYFTLMLLLMTVRILAEHQPVSYARREAADETLALEPALTRTLPVGPIQRWLFAPVGLAYHCEHHLYPAVPFTRLPQLHALLRARGFYDAQPERLGSSYLTVLRRLILPGDGRPRAARMALGTADAPQPRLAWPHVASRRLGRPV